ncbi:hypothetical protein [Legionella brunensis]|uniref:Uncharacterized protein n=1 Tax=Legionella brunensis TaxID=29422 RepID=A0A0W0SPF2_9GAMM|nr:hypothetical protein [Legionella brunensis]KTC85097.1 hypothetical protein Lbru_0893 [Legionella brunensis]
MLVSRVHEFIKAVVSIEHKLGKVDKEFLHDFQEKYPLLNSTTSLSVAQRNPQDSLNEYELQWIQEIFAQRWQEIADKAEDYTFDPRENNAPWVSMAKDLAIDLKKPYLLILMPVLTNKSDPEMFYRLEQDQDPRSIYLSDDNTWHRIQGLFERLQQPSAVFSTYDLKKVKPRALTLKEMFRIRSKKGAELAKEIDNETYVNFWDYVIRRIAPTWEKKGKCPEQLLPNLLEIIELYFDAKATNGNLKDFHEKLKILTRDLEACPLDDINHFYGIEIYGKQRNHYLVDILLDCLNEAPDLEEKLADVARWLCRYDPTLVSKCKNLIPVYEVLKVGEYFDASHLRQSITKLDVGVAETKPKIQELLEVIPEAGQITSEIIENIKRLYALRWQKIKDTPDDYFRKPNAENRSWIRLAQYLAGAGYIDANYYKLLIPTLTHNTDPITQENLTNYPLSHFILSEDEKELLYLPNCVSQHQANGTFYCFSITNRFRMLTLKELGRLQFAASQFYEYYMQVVATEEVNLPINKETIAALKDLVNGTLNPLALRLSHKITVDQEKIAEQAYIKFFDFLSDLPSDELARLYNHTVIWRAQKKRISEIIEDVQLNETPKVVQVSKPARVSGTAESSFITKPQEGLLLTETLPTNKEEPPRERECIAVAGQFFAKLVIDYDPQVKFRPGIEELPLAALDEMRLCSAKNVFRDWRHIDDKEATRRALTILVSLMTHSFSYVWRTGTALQVWDETNTITATGKELYKALEFALELGDFSKIRFIYTYVMRNIVDKALAQNDIIKKYTRYEDTLHWLKTIKDESLFKPENRVCFDPKLLLVTLTPLTRKYGNKSRFLIEGFLEQLVHTLMQPQNEYLQWVRINIEFNKLLSNKSLPSKDRKDILEVLRGASEQVNESEFHHSLINFLVQRLSVVGVRANKKQGIFGTNPGQHRQSFSYIKESLERHLSSFLIKQDSEKLAPTDIFSQLKEGLQELGLNQRTVLIRYLDSLQKTITPERTEPDFIAHETLSSYNLA